MIIIIFVVFAKPIRKLWCIYFVIVIMLANFEKNFVVMFLF